MTAAITAHRHDDTRTVVIQRAFAAPIDLVFRAHSEPAHLRRWFGPPGYPLTRCDVDFRVGGRFTFAMTGPDGTQNPPFGGTYLEIERPSRIVYNNGFLVDGADPQPEQQMRVIIDLVADGAHTRLTMTTVFGSPAMYAEHTSQGFIEGTSDGIEQLADLLAEVQVQA
jgi:uncharacterized protein YndB with AHSA1/START domain